MLTPREGQLSSMLKAITAAKKKNDRADAEKIADLLRVNLLPECYMMPEELRELRRILRYRNIIVRTAVDAAVSRFGTIEVFVNNTGYGHLGFFEEIAVQCTNRCHSSN